MKKVEKIVNMDPYQEGFARVRLDDGKYAFIDRNSKLQEGRYRDAWSYREGFACVELDDGKWAFIDKNGKLQKGRYREAWSYGEGFAPVELDDGKWAFIDKDSKLQEGRYEEADLYSEGFARVKLDDGMFAFIDKNGKLQEGRYREAWSYSEGFATVKLDGDAMTKTKIDKSGNMYLRNEQWLDYIKKDPLSFKFIPPQYFNDEEFIESIDNAVKDVYVNKVKTVDSASNYAIEKVAEIQNHFKMFCDIRDKKIEAVNEIKRMEEQERLKQVKIEQAKEDLIQQINNLDVGKDRG